MDKIFKISLLLLVFCALKLNAQDIEITNIYLKGGLVEVHYNLLDERIDRSYSINLYTSKDNYIQPMQAVTGDVGIDLAVGNNKVLIWNAKEEFGVAFKGSVSLELKGNYYVPFITLEGIKEGASFNRGKSHDFVWSGGRGDNVLQFDLYQADRLVKSFEEKPNNGGTSLTFPARIKPGDNYRLKVSDKKNRDEVVFTESFSIERRIPIVFQLTGAALVGAGAVILYYATRDLEDISEPPVPSN